MKKILVVDDSSETRKEISDCLQENPDFEVTLLQDGQEAFQMLSLSKNVFDLIILDYHMPYMNGIDLLRQLAKNGSPVHCPVVMITTELDERGSEVKSLNVIAWVVKPFIKLKLEKLVVQIFKYLNIS